MRLCARQIGLIRQRQCRGPWRLYLVLAGGGIPHTTASRGGTMNDKPEGWYYVGDGKLRYRDDYGWTDYYMDTSDPRAAAWPPPAPRTMLHDLREEMRHATVRTRRHARLAALFYRGR